MARTRRRWTIDRRRVAVALLAVGVARAAGAAAGAQGAAPPPLSDEMLRGGLRRIIGEARDRVFPSLVNIQVVTVLYSGGQELKGQAVGSGTIISADGHVLTNQHVTRNGRKFLCTLADKREVPARLVGEDPLTDLAVLQLEMAELPGDPNLPVAHLGDSGDLEIGDYVMAMGSPFSLSRSVSLGIVSNTERVFAGGFGSDDVEEMELEEGQRTGLFTRWIQHDALINPGNSGGPLVNLEGEVVGVNELGSGSLGFAIPSTLARRVAAALIEQGEVPRSWIGVSFKPIQRTGLAAGVLVSSVVVDGPAARAGIQAGDVLLAIDGEPLTVRFPEEVPLLLDRLASLPIGTALELACRRDGERTVARLTTERLQKDVGEEASFHAWGLTAQEITEKMARDRRLASTAGALVTGVRSGGPAQLAEPPLAAGDVIRAVDGRPVDDLAALVERYQELAAVGEEPRELVVEFDRGGKNQLSDLEPRTRETEEPPRELPKAWIGVATQPLLPELADHLGLGDERGFRVTRVYPGTEAATAGLATGDVIVALDGESVRPAGMQDAGLLARRVRSLSIGDQATLTVLRDGTRRTLPVVLERTRITPDEARRHRDVDFELSVRELTFFDRDENRWGADVDGVLVEQVEAGGWAGLGGIRPLDVVLRIDGRRIAGVDDFRRVMETIHESRPERVEVVVLRGVKTQFEYLEPDWTPDDLPSRSPA